MSQSNIALGKLIGWITTRDGVQPIDSENLFAISWRFTAGLVISTPRTEQTRSKIGSQFWSAYPSPTWPTSFCSAVQKLKIKLCVAITLFFPIKVNSFKFLPFKLCWQKPVTVVFRLQLRLRQHLDCSFHFSIESRIPFSSWRLAVPGNLYRQLGRGLDCTWSAHPSVPPA